jgi:hypothetical protein
MLSLSYIFINTFFFDVGAAVFVAVDVSELIREAD